MKGFTKIFVVIRYEEYRAISKEISNCKRKSKKSIIFTYLLLRLKLKKKNLNLEHKWGNNVLDREKVYMLCKNDVER